MNTNDTTKWNVSDILKKFTQEQSAKLQEEQLKEELKQSMMAQQAQQLSQFVPGMAPQNPEAGFEDYVQAYKQGGIHLDPSKKGTFKAQATRMGMSVQEAARHILANKEKYTPGMVKKANFARNFAKEEGGEMIRRADGSYSQRGLWDNIRANAGSGKKPTAEMLEQERKINKYPNGGVTCPENSYWDEELQTCVPQLNAEEFYKDWYSKRTLPFDEIGDKNYENVMKNILPMYNPDSTLLQSITNNSVPYEFQSMIADQPAVSGALVYNENTYEPEKILLKESLKKDPSELNATIAHEERTRVMNPYKATVFPAEHAVIEKNIKSFDEGWGHLKGNDKKTAHDMYNYLTSAAEDNIQSALFEVRQRKNLKPDQVITDADIETWIKEAQENGAFDKSSPNFDDALYKLYRLSKDNASMKNLFNYIASNTDNSNSNPNVAYARYGGDFGYLPNFF